MSLVRDVLNANQEKVSEMMKDKEEWLKKERGEEGLER